MKSKGSRFLISIIIFFMLPFFSFNCFQDATYMDPSKPITELTKYHRVYEMPLKFERSLPNCNIIILIYSFIERQDLFEEIYNSIIEGIEILNEYLYFENKIYTKKACKWKIYLAVEKEEIKNFIIKWKKEKDKNFNYLNSLLILYERKNFSEKDIIHDWLVLQIHELSHYYFYYAGNTNFCSWFEEGFAVYLEYILRNKYLPNRAKWEFEQFERVKNQKELFKEVWEYVGGNLVKKRGRKILLMKLTFKSNEKIREYIYNFWKHYDDLYFLSAAIVMTMEDYYGKEKFKEILKMYRDGIEKEKLKEMAEEAIRAKW